MSSIGQTFGGRAARVKQTLAAGAIAYALLAATSASTASAQSAVATDDQDAALQIGFNGLIQGSLQISIVPAGTTNMTAEVSTSGGGLNSAATIDFGTFASTRTADVDNGDAFRVAGPTPGLVATARLIAMVTYNGTSNATMTVARLNAAGGAPDVPLANLRVASPALPSWTAGDDGTEVPDGGQAGYDVCIAAGDATCGNGVTYEHQLAVFVPDTQPAGNFTTVVLYTGTVQ